MQAGDIRELIYRYEAANFIVNRRLNAMFRDMMPEELTVDQFATLRYLRQSGSSTSSELADIFCVGKSSITAIVARLSDKKLIQRLPEEKDRRVINLALTDEGVRLCDLMEQRVVELLSRFITQFEHAEAVTFIETFEKLAKEMTKS